MDEQRHGLEVGNVRGAAGRVIGRHGQRTHGEKVLPAESQRLAAGSQDVQSRARAQEMPDSRSRGQYVFEVVQHQQELAVANGVVQNGVYRTCATLADAERTCNDCEHQPRVAHGAEVDEGQAFVEAVGQLVDKRERQSRFRRRRAREA